MKPRTACSQPVPAMRCGSVQRKRKCTTRPQRSPPGRHNHAGTASHGAGSNPSGPSTHTSGSICPRVLREEVLDHLFQGVVGAELREGQGLPRDGVPCSVLADVLFDRVTFERCSTGRHHGLLHHLKRDRAAEGLGDVWPLPHQFYPLLKLVHPRPPCAVVVLCLLRPNHDCLPIVRLLQHLINYPHAVCNLLILPPARNVLALLQHRVQPPLNAVLVRRALCVRELQRTPVRLLGQVKIVEVCARRCSDVVCLDRVGGELYGSAGVLCSLFPSLELLVA
mmetsp:Transcript_30656/g.75206  ORF Transcript_30656/g.75206 Transcript_30656/m.75206 type:complete len:280 (+) Transcript_30656:51-890(+)